MFYKLMEMLDKLEPLINATKDDGLITGAAFLAERIAHPESYVTLLGETSSGKSTIINGLLGKHILPTKASPTTGSISEIELCDVSVPEYYAINKNATIESLSEPTFLLLIENPDGTLQRLKLKTKTPSADMMSMRLFDTPGYGSIVSEHEEILKVFLPNSDVIVYVVQYKIGVQEEDHLFLSFLRELVRKDAKTVLVINRCPPDITPKDKRIREITGYVKDILRACLVSLH